MSRAFRRLLFGAFLGMLLARVLRRGGRHAGRGYFDPDGPAWGRHGAGRRHGHHHYD
jgi:hypothetical protein